MVKAASVILGVEPNLVVSPLRQSRGMNTPTLFDGDFVVDVEFDESRRLKAQTHIREINDTRINRQSREEMIARRHAAIARLRRRRHEADEVEHEYWLRRRNNIHLVE